MESILTSVKKVLGVTEEYEHFDEDIIMHINSVFSTLHQLGVGPENGFTISDESAMWSDYITDPKLSFIKTYMCLKVRLAFDPPQNYNLIEAIKAQINELEWRINVAVDPEK